MINCAEKAVINKNLVKRCHIPSATITIQVYSSEFCCTTISSFVQSSELISEDKFTFHLVGYPQKSVIMRSGNEVFNCTRQSSFQSSICTSYQICFLTKQIPDNLVSKSVLFIPRFVFHWTNTR